MKTPANTLTIEPLTHIEKLLDRAMIWPMYLLQAPTFNEVPQRTHAWNNTPVQHHTASALRKGNIVHEDARETSKPRLLFGFIPRFHMPIIGGWKHYVVLAPTMYLTDAWYVGWVTTSRAGVSRIPLGKEGVRMLLGDEAVSFFAIIKDGRQIHLSRLGYGTIGDGGPWKHLPLL
jgi:hypothetical protein